MKQPPKHEGDLLHEQARSKCRAIARAIASMELMHEQATIAQCVCTLMVVLPGYPPHRPSACAPSRAVRCASTSVLRADCAAPRLRTAWTSLRTPRSWVRHMLPVPRAEL
eukprot:scaffold114527_cov42-Phaeocystis_antarctica.AAC.2